MRVSEVTKVIEGRIPKQAACDWDNVGLLLGDADWDVNLIYVALDCTDEVIEHAIAEGADMIVTHHPMIFSSMKKITADDFIGRRIIRLIENHIAYYAMHTSYDVCEMGDLAADVLGLLETETLEVTYDGADFDPMAAAGDGTDALTPIHCSDQMGIGKVGLVPDKVRPALEDYASWVKDAFDISHVTVYGDLEKKIRKVAICPGSGKSDVNEALASGADVYITGDVDHHTAIDCVARGLAVIDAGHYGVEHIFIEKEAMTLRAQLADVGVLTEPKQEPGTVIM